MICSTVNLRTRLEVAPVVGQVELGSPTDVSLYLAGPIDSSGREDLNLPAFHAAARELRDAGYIVFNPADRLGAKYLPPNADRGMIQRRNFKGLAGCDVLVLLPGWEKSPGVEAELIAAREFGMPAVRIHELLPSWPCGAALEKPADHPGRIHVPLMVGAVALAAAILVFVFLIVQFSVR